MIMRQITMGNKFLIRAATAAHQVEDSNNHSDNWMREKLQKVAKESLQVLGALAR